MKKLTNKKLNIVKIPILYNEYSVYVIWGDQKKKLKWLRKYFDDDSISDYNWEYIKGVTYGIKGDDPVIVLMKNKNFWSILAHEAVHAVDKIFTYIDDDNRDELFAHFVGIIVKEVEDYVKKNGNK
jgi:hypothetical protein